MPNEIDMLDAVSQDKLRTALQALEQGDFSARLPVEVNGRDADLARSFNLIAERNQALADELRRLGRVVGKEGDLSQRARLSWTEGGWGEAIGLLNGLLDDLKQSQSTSRELRKQHQRLQQTNATLEEKAQVLAGQKSKVENTNREIEQARQALKEKAAQIALTSKYKSQFLANMSHELRTPLNSMLLLARQLVDNPERTMTDKQVEFARVIQGAGNELLRLINDILDLSKIESGTVTVEVSEVQFWEIQDFVERNFRVLAKSKELEFGVDLDASLPPALLTDGRRLEQILKNLLANAFKFTSAGSVRLQIQPASPGWNTANLTLNRAQNMVAFVVSDTGIGIPHENQKIIFEAFQQGDGSTNRQFGGTGLGLTISREIAQMLGGEIQLCSTPGVGSVFTLYLPQNFAGIPVNPNCACPAAPVELFMRGETHPLDDRDKIHTGDRVLLSIEDDADFSRCLLDLAREAGFRALSATHGDQALELVQDYRPDAITLDLTLPDVDGWIILERLKSNPLTRHIPVTIISAEEEHLRARRTGALTCLVKPAPRSAIKKVLLKMKAFLQPHEKALLIVKENAEESRRAAALVVGQARSVCVSGGQAALAALKRESFQCAIVDSELPDMSGLHLIQEMKKERLRNVAVILHSRQAMSQKEKNQLRKAERHQVIKEVRSMERLLDHTALLLHLETAKLPEPGRGTIEKLHSYPTILGGKRVLVVDDDIRNLFALTSLLERYGMKVSSTETGQAALDFLKQTEVDVVLMDIMMPGLDGYETMRLLRSNKQIEQLPVIAVTAKAMKEDRAKCLQAGATDYVPKPVDSRQLLSTLCRCLYQ